MLNDGFVSRHRPFRMCVACGRKTGKQDLLRVAVTAQGSVTADDTGKARGRGAYLCRSMGCLGGALKRGRLEHVLRTKVSEGDWEILVGGLKGLADQFASA